MTKDGAVFAKGKIKGEVNYPPFERLDEETMREVQKFQVYPLGKIQEYCRHIPYNSEKKSFLERTGRESFEGMMTMQARVLVANLNCSLPVRFQSPWGRQGLHGDVGLQHRARSHHSVLQVLQILQGQQPNHAAVLWVSADIYRRLRRKCST